MRRNCLYIIHLLLVMWLIAPSCTSDENEVNGIINPEGGDKIVLKLLFPEQNATKSTTENGDDNLNENRIKTLDVFIYQQNQTTCLFYQHITLSPELTGTGVYSKLLDASQEMFSLNTTHSIYVVANYTGTIPTGGLSLTALNALAVTSLDPDKKQDAFIMDGVSNMVLNNGILVNKDVPVTLKRAASKIRLSFNYYNGFLLSVGNNITKKLVKYATNSSLMENGTAVTPVLQNMASFTNQNSGAGTSNKIIVYSYANDWNTTPGNATHLIVNVPIQDILGLVSLSNYYKIPVNYRLPDDDNSSHTPQEDEARKSLYKLERDKLYDVLVNIDRLGSLTPETAVPLAANYTIQDWTTKEVLVNVENANFIFVKDQDIKLSNSTTFTTTFQSSTPDVQITNLTVNGVAVANGGTDVNVTFTANAKTGNITINSVLPNSFIPKVITFVVKNGAALTQTVTVTQYPWLYLNANISADASGTGNAKNMYVMTTLLADFGTLPNPDEFTEDFGTGFIHYAANPTLGISYADYIRTNAVIGYPLTDATGATIDTGENNRRVSPHFMLASQFGVTGAGSYAVSKTLCNIYVERDATTGLTYSDWRMPTLAEVYMLDILQNVKLCQAKKILEGQCYWSARASQSVACMDPRLGNTSIWGPYNAGVRCVRDVK